MRMVKGDSEEALPNRVPTSNGKKIIAVMKQTSKEEKREEAKEEQNQDQDQDQDQEQKKEDTGKVDEDNQYSYQEFNMLKTARVAPFRNANATRTASGGGRRRAV